MDLFKENTKFHKAFTMAEILLSLTIIGVVAAITLPSLTGNINERTWNTQRKALYSRFSQAIALMPALNGYGTLNDTTDTATETFLTSGLSKVLKINNICSDNLSDCGISTTYIDMSGTKQSMPTTLYELNTDFQSAYITLYNISYSTPDTKAAAFETQNGENIVAYYNRSCVAEYQDSYTVTSSSGAGAAGFPIKSMCLNFIYDLNGKKGPNTVGKDIGFITVFNATDSIVVAPMPSSSQNAGNSTSGYLWEEARSLCSNENQETRIPNMHELASIMINKHLTNLTGHCHWSGTTFVRDAHKAWHVCSVESATGYWSAGRKAALSYLVRCINR